ncbi:autotransporter outer membrane beta-barrel domain-containing protein [Bartonella tribocorum]|uniref:Autotransporter outer membrane beta-barrel domain-containing protein n=1 Tax=Bartonella tribocorum TaxID=85701 RepID=A0A2M6URN6_9HYPH|nr:autotransporter outer membrane beta-barrel domain-containing protein [Bartonella tribocorum]PIT68848.1 autotransporter outer membrane beta-barrel domain-containing protein [Bartonella tribocorum]
MVSLFKNRFSLYAFTTAVLFFTHNVGVFAHNAESQILSGKGQDSCNQDAAYFWCNNSSSRYFLVNKSYQKTDKNMDQTVAIHSIGYGTRVFGIKVTIKDAANADNLEGSFWKYGVLASSRGEVFIKGGEISFTHGIGVGVEDGGKILLERVSITETGGQGLSIGDSENSAFHVSGVGAIHFEKGKVKLANAHGFSMHGDNINMNGNMDGRHISIEDSTVLVESDTAYGLRFREGLGDKNKIGSLPKTSLPVRSNVSLLRTTFRVPNSIAIHSRKSGAVVKLLDKSELSGDLLLKAEGDSLVRILANDSMLVGGVRVDESSFAEFRLRDGSKWTLSRPKNKTLQVPSSIGVSSISLIHLIDSSIVFEKPTDNATNDYQTLHIGKGEGVVYKAQGDAHIYLNTYLNKGGDIRNQKTDRLLIHGDVEGETVIHVQSVSGSPGGGTGHHGNDKGISIIQVSGKAEKDSFQLDGDYVALEGLPYQYKLYAYGPNSELGKASASQRLVEGNGDFWDFRLENGYIDSDPTSKPTQNSKFVSASRPNQGDKAVVSMSSADSFSKIEDVSSSRRGVRSVVPQVPTYLLLPNSLLQAGLIDISNQNKQLETQRANPRGVLEIRANPASFLRGYGGSYHYTSDLSALEYGYGGDLGYYALEAGVLLQKIENVENVISFGIMGSYGKLSLQPLNVEQSQKSTFDKWTATVYGSMQHDTGFYVDGLASYGLFKGDVMTTARGKTATLKGNPLSLSLMSGKKVVTGYEGVVFDPQVQVVYQHLWFDEARDIDNFNIEMDKLDQWMVRIGGRLTKTLAVPEKDRDVSFYGKVHFAHDFGKERSVRFKDSFQLGVFGSSLEAGLGLNARLSEKIAFHGDLVYQHKLSKGGFSGISFSGGLRYRF